MSIEKVTIGPHVLYLGDCRAVLPTLGKVDLCLTDPPFGLGNFVQTSGNIRGEKVTWNDETPGPEVFQFIQKLSTHRIIWGANFFNCFEPNGGAIFWDKCQPMPNFSKGDIASCTHYKKTEIIKIPWTNFTVTHKGETDHPCERPVDLYKWCINYMPQPIQSILDPFMGSASVGIAATHLGRTFIGIERERRYFDIACRRVEEAVNQTALFTGEVKAQKQPELFNNPQDVDI